MVVVPLAVFFAFAGLILGVVFVSGVVPVTSPFPFVESAATLLVLQSPTWRTALLVALVAWASARLYYFMFYVIEKYVDGAYKFSGVTSFVMYVLRRHRSRTQDDREDLPS